MVDQDIFIDGFGTIRLAGGVVRIELARAVFDDADADGRPKLAPNGMLIMPVEAFLRAERQFAGVAQRLVQAGIAAGDRKLAETAAAAAAPGTVQG